MPQAFSSRANGINNREDIAGSYTDAMNVNHTFVFSKGRYTTLDFPAAQLTTGMGINDLGDVVGLVLFLDAKGVQTRIRVAQREIPPVGLSQ